jgi:propionaldehyde dehydrogenase
MEINKDLIKIIAEQVVAQIEKNGVSEPTNVSKAGIDGIFEDVNAAVDAAFQAQKELESISLEKRGEMISAIRKIARENVEMLASMELKETGMGNYEHKIAKHFMIIDLTPGIEDILPEVFTGDNGLTLIERRPFGVGGCIVPSTAPSVTVIHNSICMIASGNSAVISPHPGGKNTSLKVVELINQAIKEVGGPENVITTFREASIKNAEVLMKHPKIAFLLATGGPGVVKAVLSSGKKAIGAGAGNPPVLVDETADIPKAAKDIVAGNSFENCIQCIGEKEVLVVDSVADELISEMTKNGAYLLKDPNQIEKLTNLVTLENGAPNKKYIGKDAAIILRDMGISVDDDIKNIIYEVPADHITVVEEYLMPILPIVRVKNVDEGIDLAVSIEGGRRHTAVIHSKNVDNMARYAKAISTTILVKNGSSFCGSGMGGEGYTTASIAGPTGEGMTTPRTFTRQQRCALIGEMCLRGASKSK